jgi:hypothetical protein
VALDDHERIGPVLGSMERAFSLRAAEHEEAAERAKDDKRKQLAKHINIPMEHRRRLEMAHDATIRHHEEEGAKYRRRSDYLRAGYVLDSPSERRDGDFMRQHHDLVDLARKAGRLRYSEELAASQAEGGASAASLAQAARSQERAGVHWPRVEPRLHDEDNT